MMLNEAPSGHTAKLLTFDIFVHKHQNPYLVQAYNLRVQAPSLKEILPLQQEEIHLSRERRFPEHLA